MKPWTGPSISPDFMPEIGHVEAQAHTNITGACLEGSTSLSSTTVPQKSAVGSTGSETWTMAGPTNMWQVFQLKTYWNSVGPQACCWFIYSIFQVQQKGTDLMLSIRACRRFPRSSRGDSKQIACWSVLTWHNGSRLQKEGRGLPSQCLVECCQPYFSTTSSHLSRLEQPNRHILAK